jgi:hypothetical protein
MAKDVEVLLENIGYTYFKVGEPILLDDLIIRILCGKEKRYVKAIPFVIYLSTKKEDIIFDLHGLLKKAKAKKLVGEVYELLSVTLQVLEKTDTQNRLIPMLQKLVTKKTHCSSLFLFDEYLHDFVVQKKLYEAQQQITMADKIAKEKEDDIQYALHVLFKPKQREIIQKILGDAPLTKIEYDYYFKTIKKRLRAVKLLADFADTLIQKKVSKERT